jgi:hypothetical protein
MQIGQQADSNKKQQALADNGPVSIEDSIGIIGNSIGK